MKFELPALPYEYNALEPIIDEATMRLHHDKHHATYVAKLNEALETHPELAEKTLEELLVDLQSVPEDIRGKVRNHGGGHFNHSMFWKLMKKECDIPPTIETILIKGFGSIESFKKSFSDAAKNIFGSGWAWLVVNRNGELEILTTANQDCPLSVGAVPLLCLDVWEHAYYLKYQNRRAEYVDAWWGVVNWEEVGKNWQATVR